MAEQNLNKVCVNFAQDFTEPQKAQARANIGAAAAGSIPSPSNSNPNAPGTAAPGSSGDYARADHVHPQQTVPSPSDSNPSAPGTASPGTSSEYSRADHVHPEQTLPDASATSKGVVKLGSSTVQTESAQSPSSTTGRTYPVQNDSNGNMCVNVPWTSGGSPGQSTITYHEYYTQNYTLDATDITNGKVTLPCAISSQDILQSGIPYFMNIVIELAEFNANAPDSTPMVVVVYNGLNQRIATITGIYTTKGGSMKGYFTGNTTVAIGSNMLADTRNLEIFWPSGTFLAGDTFQVIAHTYMMSQGITT